MENLNEGKKGKKPMYMAELAEIDKQSAITTMEAKISKLDEMMKQKRDKLKMVSEDENLSELIDSGKQKMMEREIKEIERAKLKLEKLYEKMTKGKKKPEMVDEEEKMDEGHGGGMSMYDEDDDKMDEGHGGRMGMYDEDDSKMEEGYGGSMYDEDTVDEAHCAEEDDTDVKEEEVNEEVSRWKKLAGL